MADGETARDAIAIVGGGLGGLSAAIHLRRAGFEVDLFESNAQVGGRANQLSVDGFTFDTGPSLLNYPWVFEELFAAAGRRMEDYVELLPVDPGICFRWPDGQRLQLTSRYDRLLEEFGRFERGADTRLAAFFRDTATKYRLAFEKLISRNVDNPLRWLLAANPAELARITVWRSLDAELRAFFRSREIREALGSYGMYLGGSPFDLPGFFSILAYGELAFGLWLPRGGIYGLVRGIARLAEELGVRIHVNAPVSRIVARGGRVSGLTFADGTTREYARIVSNVDVPTTDTALLESENGVLARGQRRAARMRMTPGVITFYWAVRGRLDDASHHTIYLPRDYRNTFRELFRSNRVSEDLAFYTSIASETDPALAPAGDSAMFVLVPTPTLDRLNGVEWPRVVDAVRGRVLTRLRQHGVELDESRIAHETVWTPTAWRDRFGLYAGSAFGAAHTFFQIGPFRARNFRPDVRGLYYTGASTTPGTGMPMVTLSGRLTADRIAAHAC